MCDWNDFEINEPYDGEEISSVLGGDASPVHRVHEKTQWWRGRHWRNQLVNVGQTRILTRTQ